VLLGKLPDDGIGGADRALRVDRAAVGRVAIPTSERQVIEGQVPGAGDIEQAEGFGGGVTLDGGAVAVNGDGRIDDGQAILAVERIIGRGERVGTVLQRDDVGIRVGVGRADGRDESCYITLIHKLHSPFI